ncbi:MAG: hypothetical protein E6J88_19845 [Deltaproteobacteria bacterium]|nr:MAG: hypothetical protein E6J88_19845 [Deltaproteobacteria bacterium]
MRTLTIALLLCACASGTKEGPVPGATTVAGSLPSNAAPPAPSTPEAGKQAAPGPAGAPAAPAAPGGPMTASEAAAAAVSEDSSCASDDDCTPTMIGPGACCPMLCSPRAVTKKAADALEMHVRECAQGKTCPLPSCAPPRFHTVVACEKNRCVTKTQAMQ